MSHPNSAFNPSTEVYTFKAQRQVFNFRRFCLDDSHCFISDEAAMRIEKMKRHSAVIERYPKNEKLRSRLGTFTVVGTLNMDVDIANSPNHFLDVSFKIVNTMYFCEKTVKYLEFYEDCLLPNNFY